MFMLLKRLFRAPPCARPAALPTPAPEPANDDVPRGCGWFDSSHDLLSGVVVWEGIIVVDNILTTPP